MLISVIVPTYQRNDLLARCLDALAPGKQTLDASQYEVIITDDGRKSTAQDMLAQSYPWAQWVQGPQRGPAANRNNGAKSACGEWLAFVDDDCIPDSGWLQGIAQRLQGEDLDVIEGQTITPDKVDNPFRQGVENTQGGSYWSCNLAVRREIFFAIGAFDEDFLEPAAEDMEFGYRVTHRNLRVRFCREALVLHPTRLLTWRGVIRNTSLMRWFLLYKHKAGLAVPLSANPLQAMGSLVLDQSIYLLRTTWHLISKHDPTSWRSNLFYQGWRWITFPVLMPYLLVWELRFRKLLLARSRSA
ncbi:glycosyltransferase family 2 protein [Anthocerotibacter panamensis]|uniref:glycosyltransferase family 2 protein n=1 Tax=Anthocerotibacter panamensis TaxID=2857077 RepID=UPI001C4046E3|nr:glycosyltransferase [Anthocerotibacter panamensis]